MERTRMAFGVSGRVPRSFRNPHWLSGRSVWSKCSVRRLSSMLASILPAMDMSENASVVFAGLTVPFAFYICVTEASLNSCGIVSCCHI